jgi:Kef-type K+ transport system membrane component KefB
LLLALALFTPSAGFILDSLPTLGISPQAAFWVRGMAIATELVALAAMFFILQSASARGLVQSSAILIAMIVLLPVIFRGFARHIVPHAPKTEFAFLLMIAVACASITRRIGVYYLVGAFVVGMVAQSFRHRLPALASERMLHAVEAFSTIFVPFYFFHAGLILYRSDFSWLALVYGLAFLAICLPARVGLVFLHRRLRFHERLRESVHVSVPLAPTLVFTLVIAQILRDEFATPPAVFGGLIVYALGNTVLPSFVLRAPPPEFETPEVPPLEDEDRSKA